MLDILAVDFKICSKKTTNSQTNLFNIQKNLTFFDTLTHMYCRVYTLYHNHSDIFHMNRRLQLWMMYMLLFFHLYILWNIIDKGLGKPCTQWWSLNKSSLQSQSPTPTSHNYLLTTYIILSTPYSHPKHLDRMFPLCRIFIFFSISGTISLVKNCIESASDMISLHIICFFVLLKLTKGSLHVVLKYPVNYEPCSSTRIFFTSLNSQ